ncbi:nuclear pore complex component-domain-containing protein [Aspergillus cavernicola]|uniref:Nuclear pore complex component-domain-containing protein n=1 Tax=Aspergillus cavernicola TaxID=176166 RepID=A0ABR4I8S7_9EURO
MASLLLPSTPKAAPTPPPGPEKSQTPGKWRHPHLNEIVRRQHAGTFGDHSVKKLIWNGLALFVTWVFGNTFRSYSRWIESKTEIPTYSDLSLLIIQLVFSFNIFLALYPLFRPKDEISDIPLTPTQRVLLGLNPSSTSSPATTYATPPKYRVSGSRAASPASLSGSPLSTSASASGGRFSSSTPFSPSPSPLLHKMIPNGGREDIHRQSFGSSSPLTRSSPFKESITVPPSPSPASGKRGSLGLSNKWLYERSRRLSASNGSI